MSYEPKYWNQKGRLQALYKKLTDMIPNEGACPDSDEGGKNVNLDRMRRAANCYYDLFNNGLCNREREARELFGIRPPMKRRHDGGRRNADEPEVNFDHPDIAQYDHLMDTFIQLAAEEQGLLPKPQEAERLIRLLVAEVASLNPACLEIGAGKMATIRDAALRLQPYAEIL